MEKQVREARTKCRSIASLLTDAPNPNSKGVLMFKKRRQRAKKYTLTCFGKAEGDAGAESEGETEEEGGTSVQSGSEGDEAGPSPSLDPTWDAGYLDLLEKTGSACPAATPASLTPTANQSSRLEAPANRPAGADHQSPGSQSSANQSSSPESCGGKQPMERQTPAPAPAVPNGGWVGVSRASVVLSPPSRTPSPPPLPDPHQAGSSAVLNRTARPFTPGATPSRPTLTSVMFRPPRPKPAVAVSMVTIQPCHQASDVRRSVSSASLYIPSRSNHGATPPPSLPDPPSPRAPLPHAAGAPRSTALPPPAQPFSSPPAQAPPTCASPLPPPAASEVSPHMHLCSPPVLPPDTATPGPPAAMATAPPLQPVPAARTGLLSAARRRSGRGPMFCAVQKQDVSPNPDLMSMVQSMDGRPGGVPGGGNGPEPGPEEDWLRLGAEACNFQQAQRGPRPPPLAPKPQSPRAPAGGGGGQLFACGQSRMERAPPAAAPWAARPREPSPTPSLPATWKYSSSIRAPPPIGYNPLLSPSCPPQAHRKAQKAGVSLQPHQLRPGGGAPPKTAPVWETRRFSTPPPVSTGPAPQLLPPRSATSLGERRPEVRGRQPPPARRASPPLSSSAGPPQPASLSCAAPPPQGPRGAPAPRPHFSTCSLGLRPSVWRPGSTLS